MKNFLSTVKGKIIAGAVTLAVIAAAVVVIVLLNTGYRTISVDDLTGVTKITAGKSVSEAFKGQNLKSGYDVFVEEASDLTLALDTDKHVYAGEFTSFSLEAAGKPGKDSRTVIRLDEGSVLSEIDEKLAADESYVVESPNATMAVRGTTFTVSVNYDKEGLCHTLVEVEEGTVEVTEKDENGDPTDEIETLEAGGKTEVISLVIDRNDKDETLSDGSSSNNNSTPDSDLPPEDMELVYQDPDALAVESAIEAYINGGELDTANFDRVTDLKIYGKVAFVTLDDQFGGKGKIRGGSSSGDKINYISYGTSFNDKVKIQTSNNSLTILDFVMGMKNLKQLTVNFGKITDISGIKQLSELTDLSLNYNEISDISLLENLTKLITLHLRYNNISDISVVKGMKDLRSLGLSNNNISDISPLSELKNLEELGLGSNSISDLSPISGLTNLTSLDIGGDNISDLSPISGLANLTSLDIGGDNISDLSPISGLTNLTDLFISGDNISDLSPISGLTNLTDLFISSDNISDLSPISGLTNLTQLEVYSDNISDISPIANFKKLEYLTMWSASINDYSPLYGLTDLQIIDLEMIEDNELSKLQQALPEASITSLEF